MKTFEVATVNNHQFCVAAHVYQQTKPVEPTCCHATESTPYRRSRDHPRRTHSTYLDRPPFLFLVTPFFFCHLDSKGLSNGHFLMDGVSTTRSVSHPRTRSVEPILPSVWFCLQLVRSEGGRVLAPIVTQSTSDPAGTSKSLIWVSESRSWIAKYHIRIPDLDIQIRDLDVQIWMW